MLPAGTDWMMPAPCDSFFFLFTFWLRHQPSGATGLQGTEPARGARDGLTQDTRRGSTLETIGGTHGGTGPLQALLLPDAGY